MKHERPGLAVVAPLAIGPANCEPMLGVSWRWLRDHAAELGLEVVRVGSKSFVEAAPALAAIRRHGVPCPPSEGRSEDPTPSPEPVDELEAMRRRLGKRRRIA